MKGGVSTSRWFKKRWIVYAFIALLVARCAFKETPKPPPEPPLPPSTVGVNTNLGHASLGDSAASSSQPAARPTLGVENTSPSSVIDHPTIVVPPTKPDGPRPEYASNNPSQLSGALSPEEAAIRDQWNAWDQFECSETFFKTSFANYKKVRLFHLKAYLDEYDLMSGGNSASNLNEKLAFHKGRSKRLLAKVDFPAPECIKKRKPPPAIVGDFRPLFTSLSDWARHSGQLDVTNNAKVYKQLADEAFAETKFHVQTIEHYFGVAPAPKKPKHL